MEGPKRASSVASEVGRRMAQSFLSPRTLLSRMSVVDSPTRTATAYQDPNYLPFYFHLGRVVEPSRVFCVGLDLGLQVCCLLQGCRNPKGVFCVQPTPDGFYSPRIAMSNIRTTTSRRFPASIHIGGLNDDAVQNVRGEKFDLAMIVSPMPVDSMMDSIDFCWSVLKYDGLLVVDMLDDRKAGLIFSDFCRSRGLDSQSIKTRYGTGIAGR